MNELVKVIAGIKERPILFNSEMVQAILSNQKTQTRRLVKPQPEYRQNIAIPGHFGTFTKCGWNLDHKIGREEFPRECPFGKPGDRFWVREAWGVGSRPDPFQGSIEGLEYKADAFSLDELDDLPLYEVDHDLSEYGSRWRPSIHMPRWASRINLEITNVRIERLDDLSEEDAKAEGVRPWSSCPSEEPHVISFRDLWSKLYGSASLVQNPWVWVIEFRRVS